MRPDLRTPGPLLIALISLYVQASFLPKVAFSFPNRLAQKIVSIRGNFGIGSAHENSIFFKKNSSAKGATAEDLYHLESQNRLTTPLCFQQSRQRCLPHFEHLTKCQRRRTTLLHPRCWPVVKFTTLVLIFKATGSATTPCLAPPLH